MSIQDELRRLAASLHFAEDRISVFRAANKLDELKAEVERLKNEKENQ